MARSDYSDTERAAARRDLRDALHQFMDAHEPNTMSEKLEYGDFHDLVEKVLMETERMVYRTFRSTPRMVQKLREGAL